MISGINNTITRLLALRVSLTNPARGGQQQEEEEEKAQEVHEWQPLPVTLSAGSRRQGAGGTRPQPPGRGDSAGQGPGQGPPQTPPGQRARGPAVLQSSLAEHQHLGLRKGLYVLTKPPRFCDLQESVLSE